MASRRTFRSTRTRRNVRSILTVKPSSPSRRALRVVSGVLRYRIPLATVLQCGGRGCRRRDLGEDHDPETHLIPLVLDAAMGRKPEVRIFGTDYPTPDGTCVRDYIHVSDLASAHVVGLQALLVGKGRARRRSIWEQAAGTPFEKWSRQRDASRNQISWLRKQPGGKEIRPYLLLR